MTTNGVFKIIKVSKDRIGAIVGKKGAVKDEIESKCNVLLDIDGENGDITIKMRGNESLIDSGVFKASEIVLAISKGFSPERSYRLLSDECILQLLDLREYSGKSANSLDRIKSRVIGQSGKFRRNLEEFSGAEISIYGHFVGFIGTFDETSLALNAILMICKGSSHKTVYNMLEEYNRNKKLEKMELWETTKDFPSKNT